MPLLLQSVHLSTQLLPTLSDSHFRLIITVIQSLNQKRTRLASYRQLSFIMIIAVQLAPLEKVKQTQAAAASCMYALVIAEYGMDYNIVKIKP